jgi:predicted transcriptional regulator
MENKNKKLKVEQMLTRVTEISDEIDGVCEKIKNFFYRFEEDSLADVLETKGYVVLSPKVVEENGLDWEKARDHLKDLRKLNDAQVALKDALEKEDLLDEIKRLKKENTAMKEILEKIKKIK